VSILDDYDQSQWDRRRQRMLSDKIDTTTFLLEQLTGTTQPSDDPAVQHAPISQ